MRSRILRSAATGVGRVRAEERTRTAASNRPPQAILESMTKPAAQKRYLPTSPFKAPVAPPPKQFAVGDQVTHDMYGLGRVIGIEDGIAALVDFGSAQERILSPYAKMSKL
ncbi:hypothetical protein GCM10010269_25620 [Streptomyces humidus]|uniref:Uncharacterized protein n=2 Tax=Streptomyces TaxID=1883 RepID=A0A918L2T8_9ACTN|nr:hypothetical protein GCM10010269_25620 [Streptomyces humidus]